MKIELVSPLRRSGEENEYTSSYEGRKVYDVESGSFHEGGVHKNFDTPFSETERNICNLLARPAGWNGPDSPKPEVASIEGAYSWFLNLYRNVGALWIRPRVSSDEYGDVTFEWWNGQKKLTVYVSPETVEYVKVEKSDSSPLEMDDGIIETSKEGGALWYWLVS